MQWFTGKDLIQINTNRVFLEAALKKGVNHRGLWTYTYPDISKHPNLIDTKNTSLTHDAGLYMCTIGKQRKTLHTLNDIISAFDVSHYSVTENQDIIDLHQSLTTIAPITLLNKRLIKVIDTICNDRIIRNLACYCVHCRSPSDIAHIMIGLLSLIHI